MDRDQLIDVAADAAYRAWAAAEDQRHAEEDAARGMRRSLRRWMPSYAALPLANRRVWRSRAEPIVLELERSGLLVPAEPLLWDVEIDDPDLTRPHVFTNLPAFSGWAAMHEGARRAIEADPTHGMPGSGRPPTPPPGMSAPWLTPPGAEHVWLANPALVEAVATYARVWRGGERVLQRPVVDVRPGDPWAT